MPILAGDVLAPSASLPDSQVAAVLLWTLVYIEQGGDDDDESNKAEEPAASASQQGSPLFGLSGR